VDGRLGFLRRREPRDCLSVWPYLANMCLYRVPKKIAALLFCMTSDYACHEWNSAILLEMEVCKLDYINT